MQDTMLRIAWHAPAFSPPAMFHGPSCRSPFFIESKDANVVDQYPCRIPETMVLALSVREPDFLAYFGAMPCGGVSTSSQAAGGDAQIKVIGVGGGGGNAINRMIASGLQVRPCSPVLRLETCCCRRSLLVVCDRRVWSSGLSTQTLKH